MKLQIQDQELIEVYVTNSGHICIQQADPLEQTIDRVIVANGNAAKLAKLIESLVEDAATAEREWCEKEGNPDA